MTPEKHETPPLRDLRGRFVQMECPNPLCGGRLMDEGDGWARCDGLVDPDDPAEPLKACDRMVEIRR